MNFIRTVRTKFQSKTFIHLYQVLIDLRSFDDSVLITNNDIYLTIIIKVN